MLNNSPGRLERFLLIALLASLAIAQPLFNLLGSQAEFLVAHRFTAGVNSSCRSGLASSGRLRQNRLALVTPKVSAPFEESS